MSLRLTKHSFSARRMVGASQAEAGLGPMVFPQQIYKVSHRWSRCHCNSSALFKGHFRDRTEVPVYGWFSLQHLTQAASVTPTQLTLLKVGSVGFFSPHSALTEKTQRLPVDVISLSDGSDLK